MYRATVSTHNQPDKVYIGMTDHDFKSCYCNHKLSFNNIKYFGSTALSKLIWELKESDTPFTIKWSVIKCVATYKSGAKQCNLCLAEKIFILNADKNSLLNKKLELLAKCQHENKFYTTNFKPPEFINVCTHSLMIAVKCRETQVTEFYVTQFLKFLHIIFTII